MSRKPFTPTRTCPHRLCKPLHAVPALFGLPILAFELWHNLIFLLTLAFGIAMAVWVPKAIHFKRRPRSTPTTVKDIVQDLRESPSAIDLEMQDALYEGTGWRQLEVRKGWAAIAVTCDLLLAVLIGTSAVQFFAEIQESARVVEAARIDATMVLGFVIAGAFFAFDLYAHKKATTPRKPKRAWLPAFLRTSA